VSRDLSRREFAGVVAGAGIVAGLRPRAAQPPTAAQIIARLRAAFGPAWRETPTDAFHAGDSNVGVTGVATTVMSTFGVLQRAAAAGRNLIITHEPTFYTGNDNVTDLTNDPVYLRKLSFIKENRLAVFRFHDNWHARRPEPMTQALAEFLGWGSMRSSDEPDVFVIPPTTIRGVAALIEEKLDVRSYRVIGQGGTSVTRVGFLPGTPPSSTAASRLLPRVDLILAGEQREWEGVYYAQDTVATGAAKGMITLGHAISEDPGMKRCADWISTFVSDVPVEWIPAGEPFTKL
jgi:putative NIF3 family GTP cyclohydrolase 1 type 2